MKILDMAALENTGVFAGRNEAVSYLLMKQMEHSGEPSGALLLREKLLEHGSQCSTATIGRYLREMDYKDFTVQQSNQGRVLTPKGRAYLTDVDAKISRTLMHDSVGEIVQVKQHEELTDLIRTRIALEKESAGLAALHATDEEKQAMMDNVRAHSNIVKSNKDPTDIALEFHAMIAHISHNKFIYALLNMLIFEEKIIESRFNSLITRERGRTYVVEHDQIADAIVRSDAQEARRLMEEHLTVILDTLCSTAQ